MTTRHDRILEGFQHRAAKSNAWRDKLRVALDTFLPLVAEKVGCPPSCIFNRGVKVFGTGLSTEVYYLCGLNPGQYVEVSMDIWIGVEHEPGSPHKSTLYITHGSGRRCLLNEDTADTISHKLVGMAVKAIEEKYPVESSPWAD